MTVVFISRGTMSGVRRLLETLRRRRDVRCISREDLVRTVNGYGELASRVVKELTEALADYDRFCERRRPYLVLMRKALLEEIGDDPLVYHGHSGHLLVPPVRHFVRVRINAPLAMRVAAVIEHRGCDEEEARRTIAEADDARVRWARFIYARDIRNPLLYDVCLNLEHLTLDTACGILEDILEEEDLQPTAESRAEVERLRRSTGVEAALVTDPRTSHLEIAAVVKPEGVRLVGPFLDDSELETVREIARSVPGVEEVEYEPGYRSAFDPDRGGWNAE